MNKMRCPLCCGKTFNTKKALIEHLANHIVNFTCPICLNSYSTISNLLNHLNMTTCKPAQNLNTIISDNNQSNKTYNVTVVMPKVEHSQGKSNIISAADFEYKDSILKEDHDLTELQEDSDIYEELLDKDGLQGSELGLLQKGQNSYTIVAHDGVPAIMHNGSVITKQNSDGTISITSARDEEDLESDPLITVADKSPASSDQEVYSCNTCGVSFSSVLEHVQNYHKDQDVVVEVNEQSQGADVVDESKEEERELSAGNQLLETVTYKDDAGDISGESQTMRRVITETGDIVETATENIDAESQSIPLSLLEEEVLDKKGRVFTRRYVQIGKVKQTEAEPEEPPPAKAPYHQVVAKEIVTMDGGEKMKVYNCVACHIYVTSLDEFKQHPCRALKFPCPHCPVSYGSGKSLSAHMKVHKSAKTPPSLKSAAPENETVETVYPTDINKGPYKCDVCATIFPTNKSLKLHRRMHDPIKSRPIEPPVEDSCDPTEDAAEKYFCTHCSKWIPVGYRTVHNNFHKSTDNFNCDICNKKFTSSSYLVMHMTVHNTEKVKVNKPDKVLPYTCLYCSRQFARPHEKVKHERIHTGEKPHCCEICGKSFRVSYCLTLHMRTHTGARPYACQHCGKRFKAHSVYNHHLLTHSDVRAYQCPFCPKAFKTSVQLAGHKNSHTKPFSCTQCNRPFASLYAVRVHTETHRRQNNLKFRCKTCGACYARSFALKDHMKQAHQQDMDASDTFRTVSPAALSEDKGWVLDTADETSASSPKMEFQEVSTTPRKRRLVAYDEDDNSD